MGCTCDARIISRIIDYKEWFWEIFLAIILVDALCEVLDSDVDEG